MVPVMVTNQLQTSVHVFLVYMYLLVHSTYTVDPALARIHKEANIHDTGMGPTDSIERSLSLCSDLEQVVPSVTIADFELQILTPFRLRRILHRKCQSHQPGDLHSTNINLC